MKNIQYTYEKIWRIIGITGIAICAILIFLNMPASALTISANASNNQIIWSWDDANQAVYVDGASMGDGAAKNFILSDLEPDTLHSLTLVNKTAGGSVTNQTRTTNDNQGGVFRYFGQWDLPFTILFIVLHIGTIVSRKWLLMLAPFFMDLGLIIFMVSNPDFTLYDMGMYVIIIALLALIIVKASESESKGE